MNPRPTPALGFLVKTWPKLSETFILEEVLGLQALGQGLRLYALQPATDARQHGAVAAVQAPVVWLPALAWRELPRYARHHLPLLLLHPLRYLGRLLAAARRGREGWATLARGGWLAWQLRRDGVPHLHAHFISTPGDVAECAAALAGLPFSLSAHAKDIYTGRAPDLQRKLNAARFTVTCTEFNCGTLRALAPQARVERMYHGVDAHTFHPAQRVQEHGPPLLLAVGRLVPKKGLDTLVHAVAALRAQGQALRCEIVGYGTERAPLQALIDSLGLAGTITLRGQLTREEVLACYARCAVFVQPSRITADGDRDGIPNVLLEALAMGLPVVATRVSGIPELVRHGHNGLLVEPDAPLALAEGIAGLLADPERAQLLGRCGRATVCEHFDNPRNLRALTRLLERDHDPLARPATA